MYLNNCYARRRFSCLPLIVLIYGLFSYASLAQESHRIYLSGSDKDHTVQWDFFCTKGMNSGKWTKIAVPSNWELQGFGQYSYGIENRKEATKANEEGLYKYMFDVPQRWKGQRVALVFEGSMTDTEVKINGKSAGATHQGGFYQFQYDITDLVKNKRNLLEVNVRKESADRSIDVAERHGDFWAFGGIYRPVYIEITPPSFIERVAIDAQANGQFYMEVFTSFDKKITQILEAQVQKLNGTPVGNVMRSSLNAPKTVLQQSFTQVDLWNAETPHLYQVVLTLKDAQGIIHTKTQRFGFRTIEVRKQDGVYVNGKKVLLKGANRHSFYPESGRTTSKALSIQDVLLMQEMNMNAVRMSHYPPDSHFLDVCDSLGMYVMDELTGWQNKYDTIPGKKLVKELVIRDVNHPCILFWDNGNEGGWNRGLDQEFHIYDPQKRPIFHPWERFNGFDSKHYITYNYLANAVLYDKDIMLPTEFMHGLYDGGHGAGLEDFWDLMLKHPYCAGGFLWSLVDEAVVRTDKNGILDGSGNNAPDGIVGPHREKEASFYTVKEVWSPVRITKRYIPLSFDGKLTVENHYTFTDLKDCSFTWQLVSFPKPSEKSLAPIINHAGTLSPHTIQPGETGYLQLPLPANWTQSEALYLKATNPQGKEIFTWSWAIPTQEIATNVTVQAAQSTVEVQEEGNVLVIHTNDAQYHFDKTTGYLTHIQQGKKVIGLSKGPTLAGVAVTLTSFKHFATPTGYKIEATYAGESGSLQVVWTFQKNAPAELSYQYSQKGEADFMGITFDYPATKIKGIKWLGRGPYRVWKNRMKGLLYGVWYKKYNDAITGEDFQYPEFKGYHAEVKWVVIETEDGDFTVQVPEERTFLQMLQPQKPKGATNDNTSPAFPTGNIGFLNAISPIGAKFNPAQLYGPQSQKNMMLNYTPIKGKIILDFTQLSNRSLE